jgi:hypothetical protein
MAGKHSITLALGLLLLVCSVALAQREKPTRLGVGFIDEIRGLHNRVVSIPNLNVGVNAANTIVAGMSLLLLLLLCGFAQCSIVELRINH